MSAAMSEPAHISALTSGEARRLTGEREGPWSLRRHAIGEFRFDGLVVGDLLCGDFNRLEWPSGGTPPHQAMAYSVLAEVGPKHERTCFLGLRFSEAPVAFWEASGVACGVDAGVAGFVSADRLTMIEADEALLDKCEGPDLLWGKHLDLDGHSFVLASSGWGDGLYEVYWGFAEDGTPAWVAIDFDILLQPIATLYKLPLPLPRGTTVVAEGIEVSTRMFSRWKPTLKRNLPQGESADLHLEGPDGPAHPRPEHGFLGDNKTTYDLTPFKGATALVIRHITGYEPMDVLDD